MFLKKNRALLEMEKGRSSGYTLIEILFVITLLSILVYLIFSAYLNLGKEAKVQRITMQQERERANLQTYLRKIIGTIGFGVDIDKLKVVNVGCVDTNLANFKGANGTIGLAKDCEISGEPVHDRLYFRTLYGSGEKKAGCWWVVTNEGNLKSMAIDKFGAECNMAPGDLCVFLNFNKQFQGLTGCEDLTLCKNCFAFYYRNQSAGTPPEVFRIHLSSFGIDDISQRQRCAPNSAKLMLQREWNIQSETLFDCVGGLRFKLEPDITNPKYVTICLLLQVSGRFDAPAEVPNASRCGNFYETLPSYDWRYYRWKVVEEIIPLENLR